MMRDQIPFPAAPEGNDCLLVKLVWCKRISAQCAGESVSSVGNMGQSHRQMDPISIMQTAIH